ncbi:MAG: valine--tRNA ligase [Clostridia bacterium]|nr:valine--tRNA ligase [Clostridia bacterium]
MKRELSKTYDPKDVENRIYEEWEKNGCFKGVSDPDKKPFTIAMPPPNVTGQLHMGHAVDNTLQDILTRFKRMQGYAALWVPGTDHASIATEAKIVEAMRKEGITKEELGRDKFMERAWAWKETYGNRIIEQLRTLGSSCDWERLHFTMDEQCSEAVLEVFTKLYREGKIYRGNRMVNWCPKCKTSISDAEVEHEDQAGHFWHLLYPIKEIEGSYIEVATTRPETMLGDTAVAINPEDERYKHLHGCHVILPLVNKEIPIVCDEHADMEKGTGAVKITPAHDPNDFEVGQRHALPMVRCLTYDGRMTGEADRKEYLDQKAAGLLSEDEPEVLDCGKYAGMTTAAARKAIVADLQELGALKEVENIRHEVGTCYRCHTVIEPMISKQWFVKMEELAKPAIEAVETGELRFVPERFTKTYLNWMRNTRDWCISRQLWWGHRIPAWYCDECGSVNVAKTAPHACSKCGSTHLTQDPDTLDTWFSSALWPFSILGWPNEDAEDFKYFYPTTTLVTGYDIIGFWVSRMIFSGLAHTGKLPFDTVVIHGIVRDNQGRKMSKSLGNGVDPLEVIQQYGADALRFMLVHGNAPGNDMRYSDERIIAMRNFTNKIWNASRFLLSKVEIDKIELPAEADLALEDKWILTRLNDTVREITSNLENYDMGIAAQNLYNFIWDTFCDWYIELAKIRFNGSDEAQKTNIEQVLCYVLVNILKLLHPFMPFITEEIYHYLPTDDGFLMMQKWPEYNEAHNFAEDAIQMEKIMALIKAIRERRTEFKVPGSKKAAVTIVTKAADLYQDSEAYLKFMAGASTVTVTGENPDDSSKMVNIVTSDANIYIPLAEMVNIEEEKAKIQSELQKAHKELEIQNKKLNNPGFMAKAPEKLVAEVKEKLQNATDLIRRLEESYQALSNL